MPTRSAVALFLFALFLASEAHLCLRSPPQRGGYPPSSEFVAALPDCYVTNAPCGSRNPSLNLTAMYAGTDFTFFFIVNELHFNANATSAGHITLEYCSAGCTELEAQFYEIGTATMNVPSNVTQPWSVSMTVEMPQIDCNPCAVRVVYTTENGIGPFYQCADVSISRPGFTDSSTVSAGSALLPALFLSIVAAIFSQLL